MATTVQLEYFRTEDGTFKEDDDGNPIVIYSDRHMYVSIIQSEHNAWEDAIREACFIMDIEIEKLERLKPLQKRVYRIHLTDNEEYMAVWAKIKFNREM